MVKLLTLPARLPALVLRWLYRISRTQKESHGRLYAFYAFPAVLALVATFGILRGIAHNWPWVNLDVQGVHVHHFTAGILILAVSGFWALCVQSGRARYILALAWGSGMGFVLDEFYVWLRLDASVFAHSQYDAVVIAVSLLLLMLLLPAGADAMFRFRGRGKLPHLEES